MKNLFNQYLENLNIIIIVVAIVVAVVAAVVAIVTTVIININFKVAKHFDVIIVNLRFFVNFKMILTVYENCLII